MHAAVRITVFAGLLVAANLARPAPVQGFAAIHCNGSIRPICWASTKCTKYEPCEADPEETCCTASTTKVRYKFKTPL